MMPSSPPEPIDARLDLSTRLMASLAIGLGFVGLGGWLTQTPQLTRFVEGLPAAMPNTTMGLILAGAALWLRHLRPSVATTRICAHLLATVLMGFGLIVLLQYLTGWDVGVDTWLFNDSLSRLTTTIPGRPSALTALNFSLIGFAILMLESRTRHGFRPAEFAAVTVISVTLLALIGHLCNIPSFYGWRSRGPDPGMALPAMLGFLVLGLGVLCSRPRGGLIEILTSPTPCGSITRRLILAPVLIPLATGLLRGAGQQAGLYSPELGNWLFAFANIFIFTLVLWWSAWLLFRSESAQRKTEDNLYQLTTELEQRIASRTAELSDAISALRTNEESIRLVLDTSLDAVIIADAKGVVSSWNREAGRIFGWSKDEIVGRSLSTTIIPPRYRAAHERGISHYLATGEGPVLNKRIEIIAIRRNGEEFPVELAIIPIRIHSTITFSAFVRDITDRKRAEEELRRSEERFRELADVMPQIVWTARPDGVPDYFNRRWFEFTGILAGSSGSDHWYPFLHPDDLASAQTRWAAAVSAGHSFQAEYRFKDCLTGQYRWHLGRALPIRDSRGKIIRWLGTCTDIHDQKQAQEDIRRLNLTLEQRVRERTAQLEDANKELEAFSYSVSHDLRAPLRHIAGFARMLEADSRSSLTATGLRYLRTISDASKQMGQLIDDLLILSRMGRAELRWELVNMDALIDESLAILAPEIEGRNIEWHRSQLPPVNGDRSLLKQVWINLLANAVKYSRPRNPSIIHVYATVTGHLTEYVVTDNGVGFDMQFADKMFGVFQRLHHADEFEGSGIGLSIVLRIVRKHGGSIRAESSPGQGATFAFTLPSTSATGHACRLDAMESPESLA